MAKVLSFPTPKSTKQIAIEALEGALAEKMAAFNSHPRNGLKPVHFGIPELERMISRLQDIL